MNNQLDNRNELIQRWQHERHSFQAGLSLLILLNSVLFLGYVPLRNVWLGVVCCCVGLFCCTISTGYLLIVQHRIEEMEKALGYEKEYQANKIIRSVPWASLLLLTFFAPIWISALVFSIKAVW
jgi:uncharacterized membrane protein (DUF485 family)